MLWISLLVCLSQIMERIQFLLWKNFLNLSERCIKSNGIYELAVVLSSASKLWLQNPSLFHFFAKFAGENVRFSKKEEKIFLGKFLQCTLQENHYNTLELIRFIETFLKCKSNSRIFFPLKLLHLPQKRA